MQSASDPTGVVRFGVFELDSARGELRKRGIKLKLQDQPLRILTLLLEQPGETITRERLREALWPDDTFVDFDHSLNAAVAKLRQTLGDTAESPRFVETVPRRGYRFVAPVEVPAPAVVPAARPYAKRKSLYVIAALLVLFAAAALTGLLRWNRSSERVFTRLTSDAGLTTDPALSPDGKLVAYASDRGGGHLHLWIQQTDPAGQAVQLTNGDWDDRQPAFSPDGSKIAFRSERAGGGVYVIPALGGQAVLIAKGGRDPRFSPDGKRIAYWAGLEWGAMRGIASGHVYVVPTTGGEPAEISGGLAIAGAPVWSPDGDRLLVFGELKRQAHYRDEFDWWIVPVSSGRAVRTGAYPAFERAGMSMSPLTAMPFPRDWTRERVLFSAKSGDSIDVWRVAIAARTGQITGVPVRVSSGTGFILPGSSATYGRVAFADLSHRMHLWSLPLDANCGTATADLAQITDGAAAECWPSITPDGKLLAYTSTRSGKRETWVKDLVTGKEAPIPLPGGALAEDFPRISPDGTRVAHTIIDKKGPELSIAPLDSSAQQRIPSLNDWVFGWSPDGRFLVCKGGVRRRLRLLNLATRAITDFLEDPEEDLFQGTFSPDGRWIAFGGFALYIAPFRSTSPIPRQQWIVVANSGYFDDKPRWSPDGNLLYFTSDRDGYRCIWAQRLNASTKEPVGDPWPVHHFHEARKSLLNVGNALTELAVAPDRLIFPLDEITGNVWLMEAHK